jgi:hypothetical protein
MKEYIIETDLVGISQFGRTAFGKITGELIRCANCSFWDKEPNQTAVPAIHLCRLWRIGTFNVDFCARASEDGWMKAMPKENKR